MEAGSRVYERVWSMSSGERQWMRRYILLEVRHLVEVAAACPVGNGI